MLIQIQQKVKKKKKEKKKKGSLLSNIDEDTF